MSQYLNRLNSSDSQLINTKVLNDTFGLENDVSELHIYDLNDNLLSSDYNYTGYKPDPNYGLINSNLQSLEVDTNYDCVSRGFEQGSFKVYYNFLRNLSNESLFVKTISSNRQEIALTSNTLSNIEIEYLYNNLKDNFEKYNYLKNYLVNFSNNKLSLIVNVALNTTEDVYEIYVKLYEPIDSNILVKSTCKMQVEVITTNIIEIDITKGLEESTPVQKLQPNFDINLEDKRSFSTDYLDNDILLSNVNFNDITKNIYSDKSLPINVNFEDFSEYIHFGNAVARINNFVEKVKLIEIYTYNIENDLGDIILYQAKLKDIIDNFDLYEQFLYKSTSDKSYPKLDGYLLPSDSQEVIDWLGTVDYEGNTSSGILKEARYYDDNNYSSLLLNIPNYILIDDKNQPLFDFMNMIGHHFDNIWIYIKKMNDIYVANNNLNKGISPDLVEFVLKSFGLKLYNSLSNVDITDESKILYNKEIYKRIYHNLPNLFKSKGTLNGLRQLINIFGIPDTIFRVYEYGSLDKDVNNLDSLQDTFNYSLYSNRDGYLNIPFKVSGSNDNVPSSFAFRLKLNSKPSGSYTSTADFNPLDFNGLDFRTSGSIFNQSETLFTIKTQSGSFVTCKIENYDGGISQISLQTSTNTSSRILTDVYDGNWSNWYLQREYNQVSNKTLYTLKIVKKTSLFYEILSTSLNVTDEPTFILDKTLSIDFGENVDYNLQSIEVRLDTLTDDNLVSRFYNTKSVESTNPDDFLTNLIYYLPLGTDLKTYNHSTTTSLDSLAKLQIFGSWKTTFIGFSNVNSYQINYDNVSYNYFGTSTSKRVNNKVKVKIENTTGEVLSNLISVEPDVNLFQNYKFLDVVFSPVFEQDDDIASMIGHLKIDDYIGSPSDLYSTKYESLDTIKKIYLSRVIGKYNVRDYIRLIQFIDNSLFKMIYDFVPLSSNTSTGLLIKQNIINRNRLGSLQPIVSKSSNGELIFDKFEFSSEIINRGSDILLTTESNFNRLNKNPFLKNKLTKQEKELFKYSDFNQEHSSKNAEWIYFESGILDSKYRGSKLSSKSLNKFSEGDISLGKTPVIESYVDKIGIFTDVTDNKIFKKKSDVQLKYLVDKFGNLIDLNKSNKNFYSVQGYFVKDNFSTVSLFDNQKYSNQKTLDGNKKVFSSGYSYEPTFYFTNKDKYFMFDSTDQEDNTFLRYIEPFDRDISKKKFVYDLFSKVDIDTTGTYNIGNEEDKRFSSYTVQKTNQYQFNLDISLLVKPTTTNFTFTYRLSTYKNYISDDSIIDSITYVYNPVDPGVDSDGNPIPTLPLGKVSRNLEIPVVGSTMENFNKYWSTQRNSLTTNAIPYKEGRLWKWDGVERIDSDTRTYRIYTSDDSDAYKTGKCYQVRNPATQVAEKLYDEYYEVNAETVNINIPVFEFNWGIFGKILIGNRGILSKDAVSIKNNNSFAKFDKVLFVLEMIDSADVEDGSITLLESSSIYTSKDLSNFKLGESDNVIIEIKPKVVTINPKFKNYLNLSKFNPEGTTLYSTYGDVDEIFSLERGDYIYMKDSKTNEFFYLEIDYVDYQSSNILVYLSNTIPSYVTKENLSECIFVKRIIDETNVVVDFKKKSGSSGYGFLIPSNINPTFLDNIDTITKEVNQKLLNDYTINKTNF